MSVKDFKASQLRTNKIIASGSKLKAGVPSLMIYSASHRGDSVGFDGGIPDYDDDDFTLLKNVGTDVFFFVSGSKTHADKPSAPGSPAHRRKDVTLFGGDIVVSGTLFAEQMVAEVNRFTSGSFMISGSMFVSGAATFSGHENVGKDGMTMPGVAIRLEKHPAADATPRSAIAWDGDDGSVDAAIYETGGNFILTSSNNIVLDTHGDDIRFRQDGTLRGALNLDSVGDLVFEDADGTEIFRIDGSADSLLMATDKKIEFHDDTQFIHANSNSQLSIAATDEINLDATDIDINGNIDVSGNAVLNGNVDLGDATSDTITATGRFDSDLLPSTNNTRDLGSSARQWKDLYIDGTGFIDTVTADSVDIDGGTIDDTVIGGNTPAAGSFTTLSATGNVDLGDNAAADTVTVTARFDSSLTPSTDNERDLGSASLKWRRAHVGQMTASFGIVTADLSVTADAYVNDDLFVSGTSKFGDSADFDDVATFNSTVKVADQIRHVDDADTVISFTPDKIQVKAGGALVLEADEGTTDTLHLGSGTPDDGNKFDRVLIMSGGAKESHNPLVAVDTNFFVSGAIHSRGKAVRGTAVFGGDVYASGTLYSNDLTVNDDAYFGDDLHVSGTTFLGTAVRVKYKIQHDGDTDTFIEFSDDLIAMGAGNKYFLEGKEGSLDVLRLGSATENESLPFQQVLILSGAAEGDGTDYDSSTGLDVAFFVSGSKDRRGHLSAGDRGTAVFGGDVVISGSLFNAFGGTIGGAAASGTFHETAAGRLVQTGSVSLAGGEGFSFATNNAGADVYFFVSGSKRISGDSSRSGVSLFGGDLVVSGVLHPTDVVVLDDVYVGDDLFVSGSATLPDEVNVGRYITHAGDADTRLDFTDDKLTIDVGGREFITMTEAVQDTIEFNILESANFNFIVNASSNESFSVSDSGVVVNEGGAPACDFRVQSNTKENAILVDSGIDAVLILSGGAKESHNPSVALDTNFFVSGAIEAKGTAVRGTAVFGGDLVVSGSVYSLSDDSIYIGTGLKQVKISAAESAGSMNVGDGGTQVLILSGGAARSPNEAAAVDTNFFVSGAIGSRGTAVRGTAVFGGDVLSSGSLRVKTGESTTENINAKGDDLIVESSGNTGISIAAGQIHTAGIYFPDAGDDDIGAITYDHGGNGLSFRANGGDHLHINRHGNVGVGTSNPTVKLDVHGVISASAGYSGSHFSTNDGRSFIAAGNAGILVVSESNGQIQISDSNNKFTRNAAAERIIMTNTDDRLHIGGDTAPNGKMELTVKSDENITGLFIDYNNTGGNSALIVDSESTSAIAAKIQGFKGLQVEQTANNGYAAEFKRNRNNAGNNPLVNMHDDHTANEQPTLQLRQDGTGDLLRMKDGSDIVHRFLDGGKVRLGGNDNVGSDVYIYISGSDNESGTATNKRTGGVALFAGDVVVSGGLYVSSRVYNEGDHDTFIRPRNDEWEIHAGGSQMMSLNKNENTVAINPDNESISTVIQGSNKQGVAVDGSLDRVLILSGGGGRSIDEAAGVDVSFYVSGSTSSRGTAVRGTSVFGGDVVLSGSFRIGAGKASIAASTFADDLVIEGTESTGISILTPNNSQGRIYFGDSDNEQRAYMIYDHNLDVMKFSVANGNRVIIDQGGLSGSLTNLISGKSYLAAGSGVTITSASDGQITIAATGGGGGGGSIGAVSGSTSVGTVTEIDFSRLGLLQDLGGNKIAVTGTIGPAEEGTYSDGLFTTFNPETPIGTAIDKLNEVLKFLAPSPAPNLSHIGTAGGTGVTALLSLGSTTGLPSPNTFNYVLVADSAGVGSAVDVNQSYTVVTSSGNIRMGIFGPNKSVIKGDLADTTAANSYSNGTINHSGSTFGDADQGTLVLEVNDSTVRSVDLTDAAIGSGNPGAGTFSSVDGNSSGFIELSVTGSGFQSNGEEFGIFKNRTGKFQVGTGTQRAGWNYARVIHTVGSTSYTTNYVEWFNAINGTNPNANDVRIEDVTLSGSKHISGIVYANGATGKYISRIDNFYDFVYATNTISFSTTNTTIASQTVPSPGTSVNAHLKSIALTGSFAVDEGSINAGTMASGSISVNFSVSHPINANMTNTGSITSAKFLLYSASQLANNQVEDFVYEDFRLKSGSYLTQGSVVAAGNSWNPTLHLTASEGEYPGQSDGLAFFAGKLKAPRQLTDNNGNFTTFNTDGHALGAPGSGFYQPNYSGISSGTRTFYRYFRNESGAAARDFDLFISGTSTTIVPITTALNSGRIRVFAKLPGTTDFLDLAQAFIFNSGGHGRYDGAHIGSFNSSLSSDNAVTNHVSFGTGSIGANEYVVIKVEADASWTGHLAGMNAIFPAVSPSAVSAAPSVNELQIDTHSGGGSFANGRLAFGASNAIGGYINVTGSTASKGFGTNVDVNGNFTSVTNNNSNKRYGIIDTSGGVKTVSGDINGDTNASGNNFTADSFQNAHEGTLKLYVNNAGTPVHQLDLAGFLGDGNPGSGAGTSTNGNGSGFQAVSVVAQGKDSDGLPDFRHHYRTAEFVVGAGDQNANGWNWAQVIHDIDGSLSQTVFVEWVNDSDSNNITINSNASSSFDAASFYTQSGVKYFNTALGSVATGSVLFRATNVYSNVYSNSNQAVRLTTLSNLTCQSINVQGSEIVNTLSSSLSSNGMGLPLLNNGGNPNTAIDITGSVTYTGGLSLPGDGSPFSSLTNVDPVATLTLRHPLDSNPTSTVTISNFLAYSGSSGASNANTSEKFRSEHFRLQSGSYDNQSSMDSLGWDTTKSLLSSDAGHQTGLLVYGLSGANGFLVSPRNTALPQGGDFRTTNNLTSPKDNVNYSGVTNERNYYRSFKNNTASDQAVITLVVKGSATLVPRSGAGADTLGANDNVHIFVRIPGKTEFLDVAKAATGGLNDGDGALSGDRDATIDASGASNEVTFSSAFVGGDPAADGSGEHLILRIQASHQWTGNITDIAITW